MINMDYNMKTDLSLLNEEKTYEEVNILHISDLHFGVGKTNREKSNYREQRKSMITSLVNELCTYQNQQGQWKPDIVVVSGDIAFRGISDEYKDYIEDFYDVIKDPEKGFGLDEDCIIECPGNHDLMRDKTVLYDYGKKKVVFARPNKKKEGESIGSELAPVSECGYEKLNRDNIGDDIDKPIVGFFHDYIVSRCGGDCQKIVRLQTPAKWPWIKFVILNSAWDCREKDDSGNDEGRLRVGLSFLEDLLPSPEIIKKKNDAIFCAVFHHPFLALSTDDGKGGKIEQNWLAASERHPIHDGEDCFADRVKTLKCILNGHVHTSIKPEYVGHEAQTGFWSVCGTLISNDTSKYHCRVIKLGRNGSIYYLDLENTFKGVADSDPWKISCKPGNHTDEQIWKKDKKQQKRLEMEAEIKEVIASKDREQFIALLSRIISQAFPAVIIDSEFIDKIIEMFVKDNTITVDDFIKRRRKEP